MVSLNETKFVSLNVTESFILTTPHVLSIRDRILILVIITVHLGYMIIDIFMYIFKKKEDNYHLLKTVYIHCKYHLLKPVQQLSAIVFIMPAKRKYTEWQIDHRPKEESNL